MLLLLLLLLLALLLLLLVLLAWLLLLLPPLAAGGLLLLLLLVQRRLPLLLAYTVAVREVATPAQVAAAATNVAVSAKLPTEWRLKRVVTKGESPTPNINLMSSELLAKN
jgi:hypothetical protein